MHQIPPFVTEIMLAIVLSGAMTNKTVVLSMATEFSQQVAVRLLEIFEAKMDLKPPIGGEEQDSKISVVVVTTPSSVSLESRAGCISFFLCNNKDRIRFKTKITKRTKNREG
jgi:hypothetical protein